MSVKLVNAKVVAADLKRKQKEYDTQMKKFVASYLDQTRNAAAIQVIRPNTTGILNPFYARKRQPNHPTRLTHRTGKMGWALKEKVSKDPSKFWGSFNKALTKLNTSALKLLVRKVKKGDIDEYLGTIRVDVSSMPGKLTTTAMGMPMETMRTIRMRFLWETGIRGKRRPYMNPAARMVLRQLGNVIDERILLLWGK